MKTVLWATLSANGNYAMSDAQHPPKQEALQDFATHVTRAGNFIVGRKTFEGFRAGGASPFANVEVVIVSASCTGLDGMKVVATPAEAVKYLQSKGYAEAIVAGGELMHNSFLADNLVDEIVFNIAPVLEGSGMNVVLPEGSYKHVELLGTQQLGNGVLQLRYAIAK